MKILIIDDEPAILQIYGDKLKTTGYGVITSVDGIDGMNKAKTQQPDLILLDIIMPKLNGLDVLKDLKTDETTRNIPVILLTNLPAEMSEEKAQKLGAADYFVKAEYDPSAVVNIVKKNFSSYQASSAHNQTDNQANSPLQSPPSQSSSTSTPAQPALPQQPNQPKS